LSTAVESKARTIDLSGDWLDLPSAPAVRAAAKDALDAGATHYTTRPGLNPLREAIAAKLLHENAVELDPHTEVLVTCGGREALFVALHVLLSPGDEALIVGPHRVAHAEIVRLAGGVAATIAPAGPDLVVDPADVAAQVSDRSRVLLLETPSYGGSLLERETLGKLAALAVEHDLVVVSLEGLEPFVHDGAVHTSIASLPGMRERTVTINGFSDAHGMRGWRVGYLAGAASFLSPMTKLKQALSICSPAVSQYAALAAIEMRDETIQGMQTAVSARRVSTLDALRDAGIVHTRNRAGIHVMLDVRHHDRTPDALVAETSAAGVGLTDGRAVGLEGWLRLSLTRPPEVLHDAVHRIAPILGAEGADNV
jgi:aminotransferase